MSTEIVLPSESGESSTKETGNKSDNSTNNGDTATTAGSLGTRQREMTTTTLVRLMGLPTATEFAMLESKIDVLTSKITNLTAKFERFGAQMPQLFHDFDRTNTQIADLREFIRRALASVVSHIDTGAQIDDVLGKSNKPVANASVDSQPAEEKKAKVLSSE